MIKIMLSAGEVSGDVHGAALAHELKKINPSAYIFGMGGEKMLSAGVDIKYDLSSRGTVGIVEILKHLPFILYGLFKVRSILKKEKPDILVLIDYQGFNMMLAGYAKKIGVRTAYYIPPQEWLWGTAKGVKKVVSTIDKIISIFEDEALIYKKAGGNVSYVGNPNLDTAKPSVDKETFCRMLCINPKFPVFGLFPGSRQQEIESLLPILIETALIIKKSIPNAQFILALSSEFFREITERQIQKSGLDILVIYGKSYDILNASNVSIAASGTTIMEAAILDAPIIMIYKLSPFTYFIGKKILKIKLPYYCMPNILAKKEVAPELIQSDVVPLKIADLSIKLLTDQKMLANIKDGYRLIRSKLGSAGAVKRAAEEIFEELKGKI